MLYLAMNSLVLLGLVGAFYLSGRWLDGVFGGSGAQQGYPVAWRFALGTTMWIGLIFVLASLGLLTPLAMTLVLLGLIVLIWRRRHTRDGDGPAPAEIEGTAEDWPARILALALGVLLAVLWLQNQWPMISWDADAYHLTIPRLYLENGGFYRIPFNVYSNWPLNTQMLFALALMTRGFVAAKLLHFTFGVATLLVVYQAVRRQTRPWAAWLGGALFLLNPVVLDEIRVAYVDLAYTFFLLLSFLLLHEGLSEPENAKRRLLQVGLLGGVAAGIKPTGILGVLVLVALFAIVSFRRRDSMARIGSGLLYLLVPTALLLLPWAIKSWVLTGNPAYPFLYRFFGGPEWSVELGRQLHEWQQSLGMGREALDYLALPVRVILLGDRGYDTFDGRILPIWLLLIPVAVFMCKGRPLIGRCLGAGGLYFVSWALTSQQMRFLIPMLPFLAIASAVSIYELTSWFPVVGRRWARWGVTLVAVATLVFTIAELVPRTATMLQQYLRQGSAVRTVAEHPVFRWIDDNLPQDAQLMFLNTNHGFFSPRPFIADSFFEASQLNDLFLAADGVQGIDRVMSDLGITHLLIENRDRHVPWPPSLFEYLNDERRVQRLYRSEDSVYDVVAILEARRSTSG